MERDFPDADLLANYIRQLNDVIGGLINFIHKIIKTRKYDSDYKCIFSEYSSALLNEIEKEYIDIRSIRKQYCKKRTRKAD